MRLLIVGLNFAPELTGVGKYSGEMAAWLAARGHEVTVVTAPPYYPAWDIPSEYRGRGWHAETWHGCEVIRCPLYVPARATGSRRVLHLASFALGAAPSAVKAAAIRRPEVVVSIAPALISSPVALAAARVARARTWLHVQDFELDAAFGIGLLGGSAVRRASAATERALLRRFDVVSTISPKMIERLGKKGVAPGRRHLFPNLVDTDAIRPLAGVSPLRRELGIADDATVVLYSGSMGEKHGLESVIAAARTMASDERSPLFLLSGDGSARERLVAMASGLPNVRFAALQPHERLNDLLGVADIHVLPQRADVADLVMPSKLGPMLASGRPVVATVTPDSQVGRALAGCGITVAPGDAAALAAAIADLARAPERRRALGVAARSYAVEHLGADRILADMEARLMALIQSRTS
ncbi:MAG: WcaI family glycosyltransferase [Gemmatimonas sp.]